MANISPISNLVNSNVLDQSHGLAGATTGLYGAIQTKSDAIEALAGELDGHTKDLRELLSLLRSQQKSDGTLEIAENSPAFKKLKKILDRLKAHGHDIDIKDFCKVENRGGKNVYVFSTEQKKQFMEQLNGMISATDAYKQEKIAELQRATSEGRDLWNLLSNMIKVYYELMRTIINDSNA
jgi:hypothetical protein